ncbi:MAG: DUF924 domain-containing protein [Bdellovibrio sp.]|nr:MAG: DUF924 domain-containing protein [Bdellovibrio sp.]
MAAPDSVLQFWFEELRPDQWFNKNHQLDAEMRERFSPLLAAAAKGELAGWRVTPLGRLAEIILLDQFSRNIYRDSPRAFAQDLLALALAEEAVGTGADRELPPTHKAFLYLPYMHSESKQVHEKALQLFSQPGLEGNLEYEKRHKAIIDQFGRYPHRNEILGRTSTPEEIEFLKKPGSSF